MTNYKYEHNEEIGHYGQTLISILTQLVVKIAKNI